MASKSPLNIKTYYEQFVEKFDSTKPGPVYIISGEEEFLKWKAQKLLLDNIVDKSTREFNYDCYSATEVTAPDVIASCNTLPFGACRRVVRLTNCNRISTAFKKQLAGYIPSMGDQTTLIMVFGEIKSPSKFHAVAAEHGVFLDCRRPFPNMLPGYISDFFKESGFKSSRENVNTLITIVGDDLSSLYNEIQKLRLSLGDDECLTPEFIRKYAGAGAIDSGMFLDALGKKDLPRALLLANGPLLQSNSALKIIFLASSMFNTIYTGLKQPRGVSLDSFFRKRVPYPKIRDYIGYISNFDTFQIEKIFSLLFYAEWEAKLNPTPGQQLLQVMSYYICNPSVFNGKNPFPGIGRFN